ncbi:PREDICTED: plexin-A1-like, partial [Priapulus caudatus]|uniref:Plexin-A1-like n=1 Tax=Priapulus caudatus TaxID=37621 RepID=A0ABM1EVD0_PRICU
TLESPCWVGARAAAAPWRQAVPRRSAVSPQIACPPLVHAFVPASGPVQGGTELEVFGDNFGSDFGHVTVDLTAGTGCEIVYRNMTYILCLTGPSPESRTRVTVQVVDKTLNVTEYKITGQATSDDLFSYEKPRMINFSPQMGPLSGGTNVTIRGVNLDIGRMRDVTIAGVTCGVISFAFKVVIKVEPMPCSVNYDGSQMVCKSPDIGSAGMVATEDSPIQAQVHFIMDGVQDTVSSEQSISRRFYYYPNPEFVPLAGGHTDVTPRRELTLQGAHLQTDWARDFNVTLGDKGTCNVTSVYADQLTCMPYLDGGQPQERHVVMVSIGNLHFLELGTVLVERDEQASWAWILAVVIVLLGAVTLLACYMKKMHKGPFKQPAATLPTVRYTAAASVPQPQYQLSHAARQHNRNGKLSRW